MKKLIIILVSLFMLCGCHKANSSNDFVVPDNFDETKQYEITFWAKNDSNVNQVNVYKKAIEDFEKLYPNVHVTLSLYTDYKRIYDDVITNISTNTTPNVCITYPDHIATYITGKNVVTPLDELIKDKNYGLGGEKLKFDGPTASEIVPEFLKEGYIGDNLYALPFMRSTEALYINKDFVEKLGYEIPEVLTWDFIFEVAEKATKKNSDGTYALNGQKIMIPFIYKSTDNMMIQMLRQLEAGYSDDKGNIQIFNDVTTKILKEIGEHYKNGAFSTFKISSYPANFLNAGQCVFAVDSTAGATWMGSKAPLIDIPEDKLVEFETVVKAIPQYDINNPKMISQGPSICVFTKNDNNETLASWLFAQFLLTNDVQIGYGKTEGYLPVTLKAQESKDYQDYISKSGIDNSEHYYVKMDATKLLMNNTTNTFVTPVFNGSASLRTTSGELIEEVCKGVKRNKKIDDEFINNLYSDMTSLYRLNQISGRVSKADLGPLPTGSKVLLISLAGVWVLIGLYTLRKYKKKEK